MDIKYSVIYCFLYCICNMCFSFSYEQNERDKVYSFLFRRSNYNHTMKSILIRFSTSACSCIETFKERVYRFLKKTASQVAVFMCNEIIYRYITFSKLINILQKLQTMGRVKLKLCNENLTFLKRDKNSCP